MKSLIAVAVLIFSFSANARVVIETKSNGDLHYSFVGFAPDARSSYGMCRVDVDEIKNSLISHNIDPEEYVAKLNQDCSNQMGAGFGMRRDSGGFSSGGMGFPYGGEITIPHAVKAAAANRKS